MATKYFALLTNIGAAKLANATALGAQVEITQMAVGDGNGALPTPNPAQTTLTHELRRAQLNMLTIDPVNTNQIIAEQVIPEDVGGWWIREIGLFDKDGDMIAIANCAETYKPQLQEGSGRVQVIRVILIVSNTEAVTLKIDPSVVLATRGYVDNLIETRQQKSDTLTALAALKPAKGKLPYFTAEKAAALADLSDFIRLMLNKGDAAGVLEYLGLGYLSSGHVFLAKRAITSTGKVAKTSGAKWARIRAWSGGGGGGGAGRTVTAGNASQGWAGQSGTYIEIWLNVEALTEYDCTIGLGGKGGAVSMTNAGNPGADGGATSITGILSCPGGKGGGQGVLGTTNNTGIAVVGTELPTATAGTILDRSVADIGAPGAQVGTSPNQSLASRGGSAPGGIGSVGGQAGRQISDGNGTGGNGNGYAAGGGGGASITNSDGFAGGDGTNGVIFIEEFA